MKHVVQGFYSSRFFEHERWRPKVAGVVLPFLSDSQRMNLEILFSEEEVYNTLWQWCGDKAQDLMA